ncbi:MAG: DegV family EDD domain-containing protein [Eggerthellaceae bacterium]|nr:DegV family EDD domain-containing protein [Eggerthellaceae bacterium]
MKTIISTDSLCDLDDKLIKDYDIKCIPIRITMGNKEYLDCINIDIDTIFVNYEKTGEIPKTSALNVNEFVDYFSDIASKAGEECEIVHISCGADLSCAYRNCCMAAEIVQTKHNLKVYVIDSCSLSSAQGMEAIDAIKLIKEGKRASEIFEYFEKNNKKYIATVLLDTLDYMKAGGRCTSLKNFLSAALLIKPALISKPEEHGMLGVGKKYRGKGKNVIIKYIGDIVDHFKDKIDRSYCMISYTTLLEFDQRKVVNDFIESNKLFEKCILTRAGVAVGTHVGPRCTGFMFKFK